MSPKCRRFGTRFCCYDIGPICPGIGVSRICQLGSCSWLKHGTCSRRRYPWTTSSTVPIGFSSNPLAICCSLHRHGRRRLQNLRRTCISRRRAICRSRPLATFWLPSCFPARVCTWAMEWSYLSSWPNTLPVLRLRKCSLVQAGQVNPQIHLLARLLLRPTNAGLSSISSGR